MIRYLSTTMPLIEEIEQDGDRINVEEEEETPAAPAAEKAPIDSKQVCERTFITFSSDSVLESNFNRTKANPPKKSICPLSKSVPFFCFSI